MLVPLLLAVALPLAAQTNLAPAKTAALLRQRLEAHLAQPRFGAAQWGVKIVSLDTGKVLFEHDADKLLSPASNTKLFTGAFALDRFGPDHRIKTSLYATNLPDASGLLESDLIVFGRGDPSFTTRRTGGDIFRALAPLVAALTNAGVSSIKGDLVGDDSSLPGPPLGAGWEWDDAQHAYGAEISALSFNDNVLELVLTPGARAGAPAVLNARPATAYLQFVNQALTGRAGQPRTIATFGSPGANVTYISGQLPLGDTGYTNEIPVHDPASWFVSVLNDALEQEGIPVAGRLRSAGWRDRQSHPIPWDRWLEIGSVESPPLREIVRETFKRSQNLYADLLLRYTGVSLTASNSFENAETRGARELAAFLRRIGINETEFHLNEGSGLSRDNLVTPGAIVKLLEFMSRQATAKAFLDALPVAGVDGTLSRRMAGTPAANNVHAKTGSLRWASGLSGYVTTAAGERLAFAILLNRYQSTDERPAGPELDTIAVQLAGLRQHSRDWKK